MSSKLSLERAWFVLSAGRTGTVWLQHLLAHDAQVEAVHEPFPARIEQIVANIRNATGFGEAALHWLFRQTRSRRLERLETGETYVEINPFLCPATDVFQGNLDTNLIHMVRDPRTWVRSMLRFKASAPFRPVINYVPFALPYPNPRPSGWRTMTDAQKQLWRWRFCNEQILGLRDSSSRYHLVRYEDLFLGDRSNRIETAQGILRAIGVQMDAETIQQALEYRANPAPRSQETHIVPDADVSAICEPLLTRFGYWI